MGTGSFSGVKYGRGVLLITHPLLVSWSWKSRAIPLPTLWATTGPVKGTVYLYLFLTATNWIGHILGRNYFLRHVIAEKVDGKMEVKGRRGRRSKKLLFDLKEKRGYCKL